MESPTGVIPEHLMGRDKRNEVRAWLKQQAIPGKQKQELFVGWCVWNQTRATQQEIRSLERSGVE